MSEARQQAERWLRTYHGSIDSTALIMAHEAGQRSARVRAEREADLARMTAKPAQAVSLPDREALVNEEAVFEYFGLNNLYVLPVLAADGDPYLIGTSEDGEMFAQGLPLEDDTGATDMNNGHLEDKPEEWWPLVPLMPVAALSPAPLTINRETIVKAIISVSEHDPDTHDFISPEKAADAVLAALSTQPAAGEVATQYRAIWPGGSTSAPLPSLIPLRESADELGIKVVIQTRAAHYTPWVTVADEPPAPELAELFPGTLAALDNLSTRPEVQS